MEFGVRGVLESRIKKMCTGCSRGNGRRLWDKRRREWIRSVVKWKLLTRLSSVHQRVTLDGKRGDEGGGTAQKTLWSNYMDGWCTEAGINDTAVSKPGAGPAPGLSVTSSGQCTSKAHIAHLWLNISFHMDVGCSGAGGRRGGCGNDGNCRLKPWGGGEKWEQPRYTSSCGDEEKRIRREDWRVYSWIRRRWGLS